MNTYNYKKGNVNVQKSDHFFSFWPSRARQPPVCTVNWSETKDKRGSALFLILISRKREVRHGWSELHEMVYLHRILRYFHLTQNSGGCRTNFVFIEVLLVCVFPSVFASFRVGAQLRAYSTTIEKWAKFNLLRPKRRLRQFP